MAEKYRNTAREKEDALIAEALEVLGRRLKEPETTYSVSDPGAVRDFLRLRMADLPHEVFSVIFLNVSNRVLAIDEMFRGTLTQTSVYPREIVKASLQHNAAAVILVHNHPSGTAEFSAADIFLTENLRRSLAMVDVLVLDHFLIAGNRIASMEEGGRSIERGSREAEHEEALIDAEAEKRRKEKSNRLSIAARTAWVRRRAATAQNKLALSA